jgi:hypothetical protein
LGEKCIDVLVGMLSSVVSLGWMLLPAHVLTSIKIGYPADLFQLRPHPVGRPAKILLGKVVHRYFHFPPRLIIHPHAEIVNRFDRGRNGKKVGRLGEVVSAWSNASTNSGQILRWERSPARRAATRAGLGREW